MSDSLPYIAPERTGRVNRRPDHRADYYSFGITLFQMLTGHLVTLPGAPGVGKSALLSELAQRANNERLIVLSGTFSKQAVNIPFSGLVEALRGLVIQLLSHSEEDLADFRRQILEALGANASVMTDLVPELVSVIAPQPSVAQLTARAACIRERVRARRTTVRAGSG